jgi:hypothetical protein
MLKKILFPIIALFLAYQSYALLKALSFVEPSKPDLSVTILLAFLLNLFITGIFAFLGFAYRTNRLLGENYYRITNPKLIYQVSKFLKMEYFKKFLLIVFWGKNKNRQKYFDGTRVGLENFDYQTRQSEFGHLAALIVIEIVVVFISSKGHYAIAFWTTFFNFISNFYPVILQRNHRIQITRIRNILNKKPTVGGVSTK